MTIENLYRESVTNLNESTSALMRELKILNEQQLKEFQGKKNGFDSLNLGTTDLKIEKLINYIKNTHYLLPPRTGHIGNWEQIIHGRSGMMDFNNVICTQRYGYPLLYCFNQTENADLNAGDWVYLPGSVIAAGERTELPLFTWNGKEFEKRGREQSLFTPFVQTLVNGELMSLVQFQYERLKDIEGFPFQLETSVIIRNEKLVKEIIYVLLEDARKQDNSRRAIQDLLSHEVHVSGEMIRSNICVHENGYRMGNLFYKNTSELVEAALYPFYAVEDSTKFFNNISTMPSSFPLVSNLLSSVLAAILCSHAPGGELLDNTSQVDVNIHFHWGARDMAGYPPVKKGYFSEKSTRKSYKRIFNTLIHKLNNIKPVYFVLIPSVVFSLYASSRHKDDSKLLSILFREVLQLDLQTKVSDTDMMIIIEDLVRNWIGKYRENLSNYFLNRFRPHSGILNEELDSQLGTFLEPEEFMQLTFKQACMIVGALHKVFERNEELM